MVLDELENHPGAGTSILHWFTGTKKELNRAIDLGCMFSIGPVMTKSKKGKGLIDSIPKDKILLETDGPFTRLKNKPLHPIDAFLVVSYLSERWNESQDVVTKLLKNNLRQLVLCHIG